MSHLLAGVTSSSSLPAVSAQRPHRRRRAAAAFAEALEPRTLLSAVWPLGEAPLFSATATPLAAVQADTVPGLPAALGGLADPQSSPVDEGLPADVNGVVYSNMGGSYAAYPASTGPLGYDDYNSINDANINLTQLRFVGGVTAAGGVLDFEFYTSTGTFVTAFSVQFASAGNYIYAITVAPSVTIPDSGLLQIVAAAGTTGQWFLSTATPTVGTQDPAVGGASGGYTHKFELTNTIVVGQPDLSPAWWAGWDDAIVISTTTGTNTDAQQIPVGSTVYVDYAVGNFGAGPAGASTTTLKLDGVVVDTRSTTALSAGYGQYYLDFPLTGLSTGIHTLTVTADASGVVTETDETDNTYTKEFYVASTYAGDIHGSKFHDANSNGQRDAGEIGLPGWTIYLDLNGNSQLDSPTEPSAITNANGDYTLLGVPTGLYNLMAVPQPGWQQTTPGSAGATNNDFEINVVFPDSSITPSQQAAFNAAADRWAEIITGDLPDIGFNGFFFDDLQIEATAVAIDGVGGVLGMAGPSLVRTSSLLPITGIMMFDSADMASMESGGFLTDVITHEMGHVLGFGTVWQGLGLLSGAGTSDPQFLGALAAAEYASIFGVAATTVPVEGTGGPGTADGHWRETIFRDELMTGWISGPVRPISRVTVASLADMGYQVDMTAADPYTAPVSAPLTGSLLASDGYFLRPQVTMMPPEETLAAEPLDEGPLALTPYSYQVHVNPGESVQNISFGSILPPVAGSATGGDIIRISRVGTTGVVTDVTTSTTLASFPIALPTLVRISSMGGDDVITVDFSNGSPIPVGGLSIDAGAPSASDALRIVGTAGADTVTVNSSSATVNGASFTFTNIEHITYDPNGGATALTANAGVDLAATQTFSSLTIAAGAAVTVLPGMNKVLTVSHLTVSPTGRLDLTDNDLIMKGTNAAAVRSLLVAGFHAGDWSGPGLTSSAARNDTTYLTALGYADNAELGYTTFAGQPVSSSDILVKYTYYGDSDLNGIVDADDLTNWIDGFNSVGSPLWLYGDFDYSGVVDADDLTLWVDGFLNPAGPLVSPLQRQPAAASVSPTTAKPAGLFSDTRIGDEDDALADLIG